MKRGIARETGQEAAPNWHTPQRASSISQGRWRKQLHRPVEFATVSGLSNFQIAGAQRGVRRHACDARALRLRCNFDVLDLARRGRNRMPVFAHAFKMELDGLADLGFNLRDGCSGSHATWKVRYVGRVVAFGSLDHDGVTHMASLLQARLLQDAVLRARCEVIAWLARNSDATGLGWVLELAMTSTGCCEIPIILLQQPEDFAHLHRERIAGRHPSHRRLRAGPGRPTDVSPVLLTPNERLGFGRTRLVLRCRT